MEGEIPLLYRKVYLRIQFADCYGITLSESCKKVNGVSAEKIQRFVVVWSNLMAKRDLLLFWNMFARMYVFIWHRLKIVKDRSSSNPPIRENKQLNIHQKDRSLIRHANKTISSMINKTGWITLPNKTSNIWRHQLLDLWKLKSKHCSFNINIRISNKTSSPQTQSPSFLKKQIKLWYKRS